MKSYIKSASMYLAAVAVLFFNLVGASQANTVSISPTASIVNVGDTFTIDIVGSGFLDGADGGGVNLAFNAGVLNATSVTLDPLWNFNADAGTIDNTAGTISGIEFATFASSGTDFTIGTVTFVAVVAGSSILDLSESFALGGFASGGIPLTVSFQGGDVTVVPLPAAVWLLLSGMTLLGARIRRAKSR